MLEFGPAIGRGVARAVAIFIAGAWGATLHAQGLTKLDLGFGVDVGGEAERYLRQLQLTGDAADVPFTLQPFTFSTAEKLMPRSAQHPWAGRFSSPVSAKSWKVLRPSVAVISNSAFPFQPTVGPTWAGRGLTTTVQGGVSARFRRLAVSLAPVAFIAQNSDFALAPNGQPVASKYQDARFPGSIDHPQRFGAQQYGRLDLGSSFVALDLPGVAVGVSNAPQRWGPAREYPLILGPAAGGFPHVYVGTGKPANIGIGTVQARFIGGVLTQTAYSPAPADQPERASSALTAGFYPRGVDGLELGFTRFFTTTAKLTARRFLRPFSLIALVGAQGDTDGANIVQENQIASVFFRWALPTAGFEVYGEWYREDFPGDLRKLTLKPDDLSDFEIGLQRVWVHSPSLRRVFRFEIVNTELAQQERYQRGNGYPVEPYVHGEVLQGHTQHGLILGSPEAFGGAAWRLGVDEFTPLGRRSIGIERAANFDQLPVAFPAPYPDVLYGIRAELVRFVGGRDYGIVVVPAIDLNRNLVPRDDILNLHIQLSVRGW